MSLKSPVSIFLRKINHQSNKIILTGDLDKAADILIANLVESVMDITNNKLLSKDIRRDGVAKAIDSAKSKLALIEKADRLPEHLTSLEAFVEYYNKLNKLF